MIAITYSERNLDLGAEVFGFYCYRAWELIPAHLSDQNFYLVEKRDETTRIISESFRTLEGLKQAWRRSMAVSALEDDEYVEAYTTLTGDTLPALKSSEDVKIKYNRTHIGNLNAGDYFKSVSAHEAGRNTVWKVIGAASTIGSKLCQLVETHNVKTKSNVTSVWDANHFVYKMSHYSGGENTTGLGHAEIAAKITEEVAEKIKVQITQLLIDETQRMDLEYAQLKEEYDNLRASSVRDIDRAKHLGFRTGYINARVAIGTFKFLRELVILTADDSYVRFRLLELS